MFSQQGDPLGPSRRRFEFGRDQGILGLDQRVVSGAAGTERLLGETDELAERLEPLLDKGVETWRGLRRSPLEAAEESGNLLRPSAVAAENDHAEVVEPFDLDAGAGNRPGSQRLAREDRGALGNALELPALFAELLELLRRQVPVRDGNDLPLRGRCLRLGRGGALRGPAGEQGGGQRRKEKWTCHGRIPLTEEKNAFLRRPCGRAREDAACRAPDHYSTASAGKSTGHSMPPQVAEGGAAGRRGPAARRARSASAREKPARPWAAPAPCSVGDHFPIARTSLRILERGERCVAGNGVS